MYDALSQSSCQVDKRQSYAFINMTKKLKKNEKAPKPGVSYVIVPPDGGWGWVVVGASFICNFVAEGTMYSYGLFLPSIAKGLNTPVSNVALANSLMTGFYFFFGKLLSEFAD